MPELTHATREYVATYAENPRPFVWTASADDIIRKVAKVRRLLEAGH